MVLILRQIVQQAELQFIVRDRPVQIIKDRTQPFCSQTGEGSKHCLPLIFRQN